MERIPSAFGRYVQDKRQTDEVQIKMIGGSYLALFGARSQQTVKGKSDATSVRQTPADWVIRDERDLFEPTMAEQTKYRVSASDIKRQTDLGTPTNSDYGIHALYSASDQRVWEVPCKKCGTWTCLGLSFPASVRMDGDRPFRACKSCGTEVFPVEGRWRAQRKLDPGAPKGWYISQLDSHNIDLEQLMFEWNSIEKGKNTEIYRADNFYNNRLGLPYDDIESRLSESMIRACAGMDLPLQSCDTPTAMGMDLGEDEHTYVIGRKVSEDRFKIIAIGKLNSWDHLDTIDLIRRYNCQWIVIDTQYAGHWVKDLRGKLSGRMVFGNRYQDSVKRHDVRLDSTTGTYVSGRTALCDRSHAVVSSRSVEFPRFGSRAMGQFSREMCNIARILDEDKITGGRKARYKKLGPDHYRHAFNYFLLAVQYMPVEKESMVYAGTIDDDYDPLTWGL